MGRRNPFYRFEQGQINHANDPHGCLGVDCLVPVCLCLSPHRVFQPGEGDQGAHEIGRNATVPLWCATWHSHLAEQANYHLSGLGAGRPPRCLLWRHMRVPGDVHFLEEPKEITIKVNYIKKLETLLEYPKYPPMRK